MDLDKNQERHVIDWLNRYGRKSCPECGGGGIAAELCALDALYDNLLPLVAVVCTTCFAVRLFSAVKMGLPPSSNPPPPGGPP